VAAFLCATGALGLGHAIALALAATDPSTYYTVTLSWPLRIFSLRAGLARLPDALYLAVSVVPLTLAVFFGTGARRPRLVVVWVLSLALILCLNASQGGISEGLGGPVSNPPHFDQMFDDSGTVTSLRALLRDAAKPEVIAGWRSPHTKSHPPLPLYLLARLRAWRCSPLVIGVGQAVVASFAPLLAFLLFRNLRLFSERTAARLALLLALTPAVNVYSGSSLEGPYLTASLVAVVLYVEAVRRSSLPALVGAGVTLVAIGLYTFGSVWVAATLPLFGFLAATDYLAKLRTRLIEVLLFSGIAAVSYIVLRLEFGYDWLSHFTQVAKHGMAVHWLTTPWLAVLSRLQNAGELLLLGPPLIVGAWFHLARRAKRGGLAGVGRYMALGLPIVPLLVLTPIYSEFARGWIVLYPALVLPCFPWLVTRRMTGVALGSAAAWTWAWQAFGNFAW
jgi:hypothetical protein